MGGYVTGLDKVIQNIRDMAEREKANTVAAAIVIGNELSEATRLNASLTDHSLKDLAEMDHPYSTKMPKDSGPHPDSQVHIQSGELYQNIEQDITRLADRVQVRVGVDEGKVPYIGYLIDGTSKMRSRDFLTEAMNEKRNTFGAIVKGHLGG